MVSDTLLSQRHYRETLTIQHLWGCCAMSANTATRIAACTVRAVTMKLWGPLKLKEGCTMKNWYRILCAEEPSSVVWSHMWPSSWPDIISLSSYACWTFYIISYNKSRLAIFWSVPVFWFVLDPHLWGGLGVKFGRPWNIIYCMPCRTPCTFCIQSNLLGPLGPPALV